eukprot:scaffold140504_cov90-Phaeocystis_antarctica.AAC.1
MPAGRCKSSCWWCKRCHSCRRRRSGTNYGSHCHRRVAPAETGPTEAVPAAAAKVRAAAARARAVAAMGSAAAVVAVPVA